MAKPSKEAPGERMAQSQILHRMEDHLRPWRKAEDPRLVFLSCYRLMTGNMLEAIRAGRFSDRDWVTRLLHRFADYYFDALSCYDCGEAVPPVWQQVHQLTTQGRLHRLQYLLLGINAHINYDLVLTLYDMLAPEWADLNESGRGRRYRDHCLVNDVIARTIDRVQDDILEPEDRLMALVDHAFGRLDEYLLAHLIRQWRQEVWEEAVAMLDTPEPERREALRRQREAEVLRRGKLLGLFG